LAAAAAVVAIALCGWMFRVDTSSRPADTQLVDTEVVHDGQPPVTLQACMNGPSGVLMPGCDAFDFDDDGAVSLADFGALQLAVADVTR
jgi:hypothetical protein